MLLENNPMPDVWGIIDAELHTRRISWATLGRAIGVSDQVLSNWKRRKVPASHYADIAGFLAWTVEQVMGLAPEPIKPPAAVPVLVSAPIYTKRAHDVAKMFDALTDPAVRQAAYAGVQAILQMAKAGQRLPDDPEPEEPTASPTRRTGLKPKKVRQ